MLYHIWLTDLAIAMIPFLGLFLFYYLVLWLPEQRAKIATMQLVAQLRPTDWVETTSGIVGQIQSLTGDTLVILSDQSTLAIKAWCVVKKLS